METINRSDLIPMEYLWDCPKCYEANYEDEVYVGAVLKCTKCGEEFEIIEPEEGK